MHYIPRIAHNRALTEIAEQLRTELDAANKKACEKYPHPRDTFSATAFELGWLQASVQSIIDRIEIEAGELP